MKKYYVLGFLFSEDKKQVVLIRKTKPDWMAGQLNGVGGKIELMDDSPMFAMIREFKEETGMDVHSWKEFCKLTGKSFDVYCFLTTGDVTQAKTMEEEEIGVFEVANLHDENTIHNLLWLIYLALDSDTIYAIANYL
jgi:8-oxo-dGTP pyrophosphatase MutT (NUDIX family)